MSNETKRYEGRIWPGPVTLAACLLELSDNLYAKLVTELPEGPQKEALVHEWAAFRDEWKPRLERIISKGR